MKKKNIAVMVVLILIAMFFFGIITFKIVPDALKCTSETINYANINWEIEGCPLGEQKWLERIDTFNFRNTYVAGVSLQLQSLSRALDISAIPITRVSARTTFPENKKLNFIYNLQSNLGIAKLKLINNGQTILDLTKDKYSPTDKGSILDIEPRFQAGLDCTRSCHPWGCLYGRWNYPHCFTTNQPLQKTVDIDIQKGSLEIILETESEKENYAQADVTLTLDNFAMTPTEPLPDPLPPSFIDNLIFYINKILAYFGVS